jgi:ABC-type dipeptide/oligopeptide/nickel transport system permease component
VEGLRQYFARRVIQAVVVLCLVSLAGFSLLHLAPGVPAAI